MPGYRQELADAIGAMLATHPVNGEPMTAAVAHRITGVSAAHISNLRRGFVASREILRKFADGLKQPRSPLMEAAGYKPLEEDKAWDHEHFGEHSEKAAPPGEEPPVFLRIDLERPWWGRKANRSELEGLPATSRTPALESHAGTFEPETDLDLGTVPGGIDWREPQTAPHGRRPTHGRLVVVGHSMAPTFPEGTQIRIRLTHEAQPGDYVVARIGDQVCFKRLAEEGGRLVLRPINGEYVGIIDDAEPFEIQGVAVEVSLPMGIYLEMRKGESG